MIGLRGYTFCRQGSHLKNQKLGEESLSRVFIREKKYIKKLSCRIDQHAIKKHALKLIQAA